MNSREIIRSMGLEMRKARQLKNDRQKDLAARMGVSRLTVMKMEKGEAAAGRVPLETWLRAAEHLDLLPTWQEVMQREADPFEIYDKKIRDEEKIRKGRVKKGH
jgi:transcriptional regulator with XRE-family HTH domain